MPTIELPSEPLPPAPTPQALPTASAADGSFATAGDETRQVHSVPNPLAQLSSIRSIRCDATSPVPNVDDTANPFDDRAAVTDTLEGLQAQHIGVLKILHELSEMVMNQVVPTNSRNGERLNDVESRHNVLMARVDGIEDTRQELLESTNSIQSCQTQILERLQRVEEYVADAQQWEWSDNGYRQPSGGPAEATYDLEEALNG